MKLTFYIIIIIFIIACANNNKKKITNSNAETELSIAYNVYVPDSINENNYEVFRTDLEGKKSINLTNHPDVAWTYLAIKNKILFISDRDTCYRCFYLYEMNYDGSAVKKITDFMLKDSWMGARNDGSELIVRPAKDSVFYIMDRNGAILQKVPTGMAYFNDPCFSPDGTEIVFRGAEKAFKKDNGYQDELYIMNSNGSQLRQLTYYPENDTTAKWHNYHAGPPRWHPTENFISYQSKQKGKSSLFAISPDGKKNGKLTDLKVNEGWHDWNDDGTLLAIETYDLNQQQFHITLMDWPDKTHRILTDTIYRFQQAPVFVKHVD